MSLTKEQLAKITEKNLENLVRKAAEGKPLADKEMATLQRAAETAEGSERLTAEKLSEISNLSTERHRQLSKLGYYPPAKRGIYELTPTLKGLVRYLRDQMVKAEGTLEEERLKKLTAERHMAELKLAKERKAALDAGAVFRAWENIVLTIRQKLMALPSKCAPRLAHLGEQTTIEAELDREVADALADLAKVQNYEDSTKEIQTGDGGSGGADETAAQD